MLVLRVQVRYFFLCVRDKNGTGTLYAERDGRGESGTKATAADSALHITLGVGCSYFACHPEHARLECAFLYAPRNPRPETTYSFIGRDKIRVVRSLPERTPVSTRVALYTAMQPTKAAERLVREIIKRNKHLHTHIGDWYLVNRMWISHCELPY